MSKTMTCTAYLDLTDRKWLVALPDFAARLANGETFNNVGAVFNVTYGRLPNGLPYAETADGYRVVAFAQGGYSRSRKVDGAYYLLMAGETVPLYSEQALCCVLGVYPRR